MFLNPGVAAGPCTGRKARFVSDLELRDNLRVCLVKCIRMNICRSLTTGAVCALLAACALPPGSIVQQPLTARPQQQPLSRPSNGAIFQAAGNRPLFEEGIPRQVGDTLTVVIEESTTTKQQESSQGSKGVDAKMNIPGFNLPFSNEYLNPLNTSGSLSASSKGSGQAAASSSFMSTITATVIDVLPNGNLSISGEKQVRINGELEFIRLSGVVNPRDIKPYSRDRGLQQGYYISSTRLADARVEQQNQGNNNLFSQPGWLTRFFLTISPF